MENMPNTKMTWTMKLPLEVNALFSVIVYKTSDN
jgi:hypothetical protein